MEYIPYNSRNSIHKSRFGAVREGENFVFRVIYYLTTPTNSTNLFVIICAICGRIKLFLLFFEGDDYIVDIGNLIPTIVWISFIIRGDVNSVSFVMPIFGGVNVASK